MDDRTLNYLQEILHTRLNEMLPLEAGLRDSLKGVQDFREAMDEVDLISKKCLCDMTSRLHSRTQQLTVEILGALRRMKVGTFGVCEDCGDDIGIERLKAQPTTTLCVHCRRSLERKGHMKAVRIDHGFRPKRTVFFSKGQEQDEETGDSLTRLQEILHR
ncbi:MAG: hypothetical protein HGA84_05425 [Syntrophobacteraceae bacterium]|nr:hypothetical protein [Syntrophobacteraceae bacterium]